MMQSCVEFVMFIRPALFISVFVTNKRLLRAIFRFHFESSRPHKDTDKRTTDSTFVDGTCGFLQTTTPTNLQRRPAVPA